MLSTLGKRAFGQRPSLKAWDWECDLGGLALPGIHSECAGFGAGVEFGVSFESFHFVHLSCMHNVHYSRLPRCYSFDGSLKGLLQESSFKE